MKIDFQETIHLKTEQELQIISKDTAFYSSEERLLALEELEKRGALPAELTESKTCISDSTARYTPLESVPTRKIYKTSMLWVGSYLGGPFVAGYMLAANFNAFGQPRSARNAWIYTVVARIAITILICFIPRQVLDAIPYVVIPIVHTAVAYALMEHYQGHNIGTHLISGGPVFSWWRVIAMGILIGFLELLVLAMLVVLIA